MNNLSSFFEKFKRISEDMLSVRQVIVEVLQESIQVPITKEKIKIHETTAVIKVTPLVKSLIQRHRTTLLEKIAKKIGEGKITDIR